VGLPAMVAETITTELPEAPLLDAPMVSRKMVDKFKPPPAVRSHKVPLGRLGYLRPSCRQCP
jgi:hypothetical protein